MTFVRHLISWSGCVMLLVLMTGALKHVAKPEHIPGEIIVKTRNQWSKTRWDAFGYEFKKTLGNGATLLRTKSLSDEALFVEIARLRRRADIVYAEPNYIYSLDQRIPNDPSFERLYGLHNEGVIGTADADIDAPEAWKVATGSREVVVGLIDSGIDYSHPDLVDNIWTNPGESGADDASQDKRSNGIDDDGNGFIDDWRGWDFTGNDNDASDEHSHGTHCAGTIGGSGNNGIGVTGVSWDVSIVPIKVFDASGSASTDLLVDAVAYANTLKVPLTSNSWGGGAFSQALRDAIQQANEQSHLFVAAAGNSGTDNDQTPHYPSSYDLPNIIAVAATDAKDQLASFSSYGANSVDVAAPGVDIFSTIPNSGYGLKSGTSMATPHVAGLAALLLSVYPEATLFDLRTRILHGAERVAALAGKVATGRINAANTLENDGVAPSPIQNLILGVSEVDGFSFSFDATGDDGDEGEASVYEVRLADAPIETQAQWDAARIVKPVVTRVDSGTVTASISNLSMNEKGWFAVRAVDNVGNSSDLGATAAYALKRVILAYENLATGMDGLEAEAPWGIETVEGASVLSDSPGATYGNGINSSLIFPAVPAQGSRLLLVLESMQDFEFNFDFGHIEVSFDDKQTWLEVAKLNGRAPWQLLTYSIPVPSSSVGQMRLRLRVTSDRSIGYDGWKIRGVRLYQEE